MYTGSDQFNNENKSTISFIIASKRPKHLGLHVTKEVQGMDIENYKTWLREITCSWIGRLDIVKMVIL